MLPFVIAGHRGDTAWLEHAQAELGRVQQTFAAFPQFGSSIPLVSLIQPVGEQPPPRADRGNDRERRSRAAVCQPAPRHLLPGGFPTYAGPRSGPSARTDPADAGAARKRDPKTAFAGAAALAARLDAAGDIELAASDTAAHYVLMTDPDFAIAQLQDFIAR